MSTKRISGRRLSRYVGTTHCQFPYHAPTNERRGTGPLLQRATIDTLPDGPLLEIFSFYVEEAYEACDPDEVLGIKQLESWRPLVHVCQRWRYLVFASPLRLKMRLVCTSGTPVRNMLNIWPPLPIVVGTRFPGFYTRSRMGDDSKDVDDITAALEHRDRVCQIGLSGMDLPFDQLPVFAAILHQSFPALTGLYLDTGSYESPILHPDSFLGGSAPRLQSLTLERIPFPELPKLLLSAKDLVQLRLLNVPHSGYISPEAMVTCLSSLTSLEIFFPFIRFPSISP